MKIINCFFILFIKIYQTIISPFLPKTCRFIPTCSEYGVESVKKFGTVKGFYLIVRRLLRCQPFCKSGYDPVPINNNRNNENK